MSKQPEPEKKQAECGCHSLLNTLCDLPENHPLGRHHFNKKCARPGCPCGEARRSRSTR